MTYRIRFNPTGTGVLSIPNLSAGNSLEGCTAQLNFVVEDENGRMSVQNPVVVDP
jgi:hypothetical protein